VTVHLADLHENMAGMRFEQTAAIAPAAAANRNLFYAKEGVVL
jgi:hypothetical protein